MSVFIGTQDYVADIDLQYLCVLEAEMRCSAKKFVRHDEFDMLARIIMEVNNLHSPTSVDGAVGFLMDIFD